MLAAYNGGRIDKWMRKINHDDDLFTLLESLPARETRNYVKGVISYLYMYRMRLDKPLPELEQLVDAGADKADLAFLSPARGGKPMSRLDETRPFIAVNIAVITVSDTRSADTDKSGDLLVSRLTEAGHNLVSRQIVKDDVSAIQACVNNSLSDPDTDCIIATGSTGLTGRDVTPEAFRGLFEKEIERFGEMFRYLFRRLAPQRCRAEQ